MQVVTPEIADTPLAYNYSKVDAQEDLEFVKSEKEAGSVLYYFLGSLLLGLGTFLAGYGFGKGQRRASGSLGTWTHTRRAVAARRAGHRPA